MIVNDISSEEDQHFLDVKFCSAQLARRRTIHIPECALLKTQNVHPLMMPAKISIAIGGDPGPGVNLGPR